jgi:3-hydroxybutyryl-CoA dehydratase
MPSPDPSLDLWVGRTARRSFEITAELVAAFAGLSGDRSPIHVDDEAARRRGFRLRVAHGALQAALVSAVLGMDLPGACGTLQSLEMQFRKPCYPGDRVEVEVRVAEAHDSVRTLLLRIRITNQDRELVSSGKAQSLIEVP